MTTNRTARDGRCDELGCDDDSHDHDQLTDDEGHPVLCAACPNEATVRLVPGGDCLCAQCLAAAL